MKIVGKMDIYKAHHGDCSNGGISHNFNEVIVVDEFSEKAPENAVVIIEKKNLNERIGKEIPRAEPANKKTGQWTMFGGCFIHTSNGIVPYSGMAIKLFDRIE